MMVNGKNLNLKQYMELENKIDVNDDFYSESFAHVVQDYYSSMGEFSDDDIKFLDDNGYDVDDFIDEEDEVLNVCARCEVQIPVGEIYCKHCMDDIEKETNLEEYYADDSNFYD